MRLSSLADANKCPWNRCQATSYEVMSNLIYEMRDAYPDNICVSTINSNWFQYRVCSCCLSTIPQTDQLVLPTAQKICLLMCVPRKTKAFLLMSLQPRLWLANIIRGFRCMLCVVKHMNISAWCFTGNNRGILWHISGTKTY